MTALAPAAEAPSPSPIRVLVVDDSAVIRGLITRLLESEADIAVVASASNGQMAVSSLRRTPADVAVLDIEMPVMDGLTALPQMLEAAPELKVIVASTLTQRNAQISLKALAAGAADYLAKPSSSGIHGASDFRRELVQKVRALGGAQRRRVERGEAAPEAPAAARLRPAAAEARAPVVLRAPSARAPEIIAFGSSTGGPQALTATLAGLPPAVSLPIVVTQHMPATFTGILAEHLARAARRPAAEAQDGEPVLPGRIYVAPGDFHMKIAAEGMRRVIRLSKEPPENFCRPAVDPMFRSLAETYGAGVLAIVLTGMGADGARGASEIARTGGSVVAQDEATSVVWGMPGAAAAAGACCAVLPLPEIPAYLSRLAGAAAA